MAGIVGDAVLGRADVARTRERRRLTRLRRLVAVGALVAGWSVMRRVSGRALFPAVHLPHWVAGALPAFLIVLMLGVVMLAPLLGAGRSPHTMVRPGETAVGLEDLVGIDSIKAEVIRTINLFLAHQTFRRHHGRVGPTRRPLRGPPGDRQDLRGQGHGQGGQRAVPLRVRLRLPVDVLRADEPQDPLLLQGAAQVRPQGGRRHRVHRGDRRHRGLAGAVWAATGRPRACTGVVNELLVQLQSFDTPTRGQKFASAWIDLLNRYLPDGAKLHKPVTVPANVLVVGATNRKDDLDPALIRPGRFDRTIYFGLPGRKARADIVAYYLGKKAHGPDLDTQGAVDLVAGMTFGYSPAALERLMDESLVIALTHGRAAMNMSDVAEAKMLVELGVTDETIYSPDERERVATHEAGHATVAYFVGQTRQLDVLSIVKRRDSLGLLQHSDTEERFTKSSEEMHALLQIAMGGMVAEEHWFEEVSTGPASDLAAATSIGAQMIGACGMGNSLISVAAAGNGYLAGSLVDKVLGDKDARRELDTLLMKSCDGAKSIVTAHPEVVEALRDARARARRAGGRGDRRRDRGGSRARAGCGRHHEPPGLATGAPGAERFGHHRRPRGLIGGPGWGSVAPVRPLWARENGGGDGRSGVERCPAARHPSYACCWSPPASSPSWRSAPGAPPRRPARPAPCRRRPRPAARWPPRWSAASRPSSSRPTATTASTCRRCRPLRAARCPCRW